MSKMLAITDLPVDKNAYFGPHLDTASILYHLEKGLVVAVGTPIVLCVGGSAVGGMMRRTDFEQIGKYAYILEGLLGCLTYPRTRTVRCLVMTTCYIGVDQFDKVPKLDNGYYLLRGSNVTAEILDSIHFTIKNWVR